MNLTNFGSKILTYYSFIELNIIILQNKFYNNVTSWNYLSFKFRIFNALYLEILETSAFVLMSLVYFDKHTLQSTSVIYNDAIMNFILYGGLGA